MLNIVRHVLFKVGLDSFPAAGALQDVDRPREVGSFVSHRGLKVLTVEVALAHARTIHRVGQNGAHVSGRQRI